MKIPFIRNIAANTVIPTGILSCDKFVIQISVLKKAEKL